MRSQTRRKTRSRPKEERKKGRKKENSHGLNTDRTRIKERFIYSVELTPDGRFGVSCSKYEPTIRVWNADHRALVRGRVRILRGHADELSQVEKENSHGLNTDEH